MEIKVTSYSSQTSLIGSILFFILGAILLTCSDKIIPILSMIIGIILAITGIVEIITYILAAKKEVNPPRKSKLVAAAISIVLAVIFIFFTGVIDSIIKFIIGGWILFTGIMRFIAVISTSPKHQRFIPLLIVSILLMGVGIFTIVGIEVVGPIVGVMIMISAAIEIAGYIFYSKDTKKTEEPGTTTLIVPDEEEHITKNEIVTKKDKKKKTKDVNEE